LETLNFNGLNGVAAQKIKLLKEAAIMKTAVRVHCP
jgi:hypothetical protein